jgi:hypothetical protein
MDTLISRDYFGFGDNIYKRPFIIQSAKYYDRVYVFTAFPELFLTGTENDKKYRFIKADTQLKTQVLNMNRPEIAHLWHSERPMGEEVSLNYHRFFIGDKRRNVIQSFELKIPVVGGVWDFKMPCQQEWLDKADALLSTINTTKKICIVRLPTCRTEWFVTTRNPKLEYIEALMKKYKDEYYYISVADCGNGEEMAEKPDMSLIDLALHNGETDVWTVAGLMKRASMTISIPCFAIPLGIALDAKVFIVYGGQIAPELLTDERMGLDNYGFAAPEPFCNCVQREHNCNKEIPYERLIESFERLKNKC